MTSAVIKTFPSKVSTLYSAHNHSNQDFSTQGTGSDFSENTDSANDLNSQVVALLTAFPGIKTLTGRLNITKLRKVDVGLYEREPWSSGYRRRLMFQRSWVRILAPYTGWTFFHIYLL